MTTQQQELKRLTDENAELLSMVESLKRDNGTLQQSVSELTARNAAYSEKVGFMDAYVVFGKTTEPTSITSTAVPGLPKELL